MARFSAILVATLVALGAVSASPIDKRAFTGSATYTDEGLVSSSDSYSIETLILTWFRHIGCLWKDQHRLATRHWRFCDVLRLLSVSTSFDLVMPWMSLFGFFASLIFFCVAATLAGTRT